MTTFIINGQCAHCSKSLLTCTINLVMNDSRGIYLCPPATGLWGDGLELSELLQSHFLGKEMQAKVGVVGVMGDHMIIRGEINLARGTADFLCDLSTHSLFWRLS